MSQSILTKGFSMRIFSKSIVAFASMSMVAMPIVASAETRPAPVMLAKVSGTRFGTVQGNVPRARAVAGERENLALGLLPLLGIAVGVVALTVVITQVVDDGSPN